MTTQFSALSGAWEGISNGPQRTASCPPMLGSREDMFPPGSSFTLQCNRTQRHLTYLGWMQLSVKIRLNFRDDKLLCFSCGTSNIHIYTEEQPQPFLSLLWWYQRQKEPWIWSKIFPFPSLLASPCIQILEECTIWNSTRFSFTKSFASIQSSRHSQDLQCDSLTAQSCTGKKREKIFMEDKM